MHVRQKQVTVPYYSIIERLTGAMLDRLTHRVHIVEANGESYRLRDSQQRMNLRRKATTKS